MNSIGKEFSISKCLNPKIKDIVSSAVRYYLQLLALSQFMLDRGKQKRRSTFQIIVCNDSIDVKLKYLMLALFNSIASYK
jgi:hypothetical protein